jgi:aspartyl-tRNA(Asn)/glutamyl-tRNA(Gln) amidotransferase subunit B
MASNWIMGEVSRRLNSAEIDIQDCPLGAVQLAALLKRIEDGTISNNAGKQVFDALWNDAGILVNRSNDEEAQEKIDSYIEAKGLKQMNDTGALEAIIDEVMTANAPMVEQFRAGKDKAFNALVGLVMKASKGKANPQQVNDVLRKKLG